MSDRIKWFPKDPSSTEPRGFDWTPYLDELQPGSPGISVVASSWSVTGPDTSLTIANPTILSSGKKTQMFYTGGTLGKRYTITNHVTTNSTPTVIDERSFGVSVEQL